MLQRFLLFMFLFFFITSPSALKAEEESSFKEGVRSTVTSTVDASKDFFYGVVEGITGDKTEEPPSASPPKVANSRLTLTRLLKVQVLNATEQKKGHWVLTVAFRNNENYQVKVTNMLGLGQVAVLDGDGFAYPLPNSMEQGADFVVLSRSAAKVRFMFDALESRPITFRLLGADFPIPH